MLFCSINDLRPGMVLGAHVADPKAPDLRLLLPGVKLDSTLIASMTSRGVASVWVEDDLTEDLNGAVAAELTGARLEVFTRLRDDLGGLSRTTLSTASVQSYRQAVIGLVMQAISSAQYAGMTDALFAADSDSSSPGLATHAANVAYLSLLCGLHAEYYVVSEQPRMARTEARDMTVLGLAGLLHDIGKTGFPPRLRAVHEAHIEQGTPLPDGYADHVTLGRALLENANAPARVSHTVLNHHQRFDGTGWPDMTAITSGRMNGPLSGHRIHIYARIVAAASVLDNLLRDAKGAKRPAVAALHDFTSPRFDGWFDPIIRRAMLLRVPPFAVGTDVKLSDGRRAVVAAPNTHDPCRPSVRLLTDAKGDRVERRGKDTIDLAAPATPSTPPLFITHAMGEEVAGYLYEAPPKIDDFAAEREAA